MALLAKTGPKRLSTQVVCSQQDFEVEPSPIGGGCLPGSNLGAFPLESWNQVDPRCTYDTSIPSSQGPPTDRSKNQRTHPPFL